MVIDNFNIGRPHLGPAKTNAPLVIDADTMLTGAITLQPFKTIAGRRSQVLKFSRRIDHIEFARSNFAEAPPLGRNLAVREEQLHLLICEASDHSAVTRYVTRTIPMSIARLALVLIENTN